MKNLNVLDLFCGCGGLSLGFELASYQIQLAIDNWKDALMTYSKNHIGVRTLHGDLLNIQPADVERNFNIYQPSVIIGGPPCQGFSVAGKRLIDDERNQLYKSFVLFVKHFRPQAFVMENVPNILSIGSGMVREAIIQDFSVLGYNITYKILNAADYGVPQNRRRAVFVGLKDNKTFCFPSPIMETPITSLEALSDLPEHSVEDGEPYTAPPLSPYQKMMRSDMEQLYNHQTTRHTTDTQRIIAMVPDGGNYKDLPEELQHTRNVHIAWTRINSRRPSITIDTGHRHHFHYKYDRVPTVRESARLQSFPDKFVFCGSKTSQYKQVV